MDIAASIQVVIEEAILKITKHVHHETGQENICLAGGVALNCVANSKILKEGPFKNIWIQPAAGDAGGALGARSILGDPRKSSTQTVMNLKIKYRESFRPFAPTVLEEKVADYFEMDRPSPYMLFVAKVNKNRRLPQPGHDEMSMLDRLKIKRSDIPAITHLDYTARLQTVNKMDKRDYHDIIKAFYDITGYGVIVNTSFNVRGEPIICTPEDAYRCFMRTEMDVLVIEDFLLIKREQPEWSEKRSWRYELELD